MAMAETNDANHIMEFPPIPSLSPPPPSPPTPLHLRGFRTGDTVQVRGDTGELQFSVHFNLRKDEPFNLLEATTPDIENYRDSVQSSPYLTPTSSTGEFGNQNNSADENAGCEESPPMGGVVTRLRSGVLSPVKYYSCGIYSVSGGSLNSGKSRKSNKGTGKGDNVFNKMLKRRNSPLRPCSSYALFLMKNWGMVKRSSFVETSKRLSKQWSKLPHDVKKEYEDMASKDNARYKRQCVLLADSG
ncbi:hypothetical protein C2S51_005460 [Perilla frutescens var. frutescens]|nr:hypothetical protein C2S51_005460 [Perilla frutescens var. frutescens]